MDNKREFFRINLYGVEVSVSHFGMRNTGELNDISGNGLSFYSTGSWVPTSVLMLKFSIKGIQFTRTAKVVRVEAAEMGKSRYAVVFIDQSEREKSQLSSVLLRIQAERRKS